MRSSSRQVDWDDLRFFIAVMRSGQISHAARQLCVDHATVARRIDHLERTLNTKLFERGRAGYSSTPAADRLMASAVAVEGTILSAESDIAGGNSDLSGRVRIGAPDGFGSMFLAPRIGQLRATHPGLDIELVTMSRPFSLSNREADIAISLELPPRGRLIGRKLTNFNMRLYASPSYLTSRDPIRSVKDLPNHEFIGYVEEFIFLRELDFLPQICEGLSARFRCSSWFGQVQAASQGVGIAVLPSFLIPNNLDLQCVLPDQVQIEQTFYLLMHEDSREIARVKAATDFVCHAVSESRMAFQPDRGEI